jgi:hypothetical protein
VRGAAREAREGGALAALALERAGAPAERAAGAAEAAGAGADAGGGGIGIWICCICAQPALAASSQAPAASKRDIISRPMG